MVYVYYLWFNIALDRPCTCRLIILWRLICNIIGCVLGVSATLIYVSLFLLRIAYRCSTDLVPNHVTIVFMINVPPKGR